MPSESWQRVYKNRRVPHYRVFSLAKPSGDIGWRPGVQLGGAFEVLSWLLEGECSPIQREHGGLFLAELESYRGRTPSWALGNVVGLVQ